MLSGCERCLLSANPTSYRGVLRAALNTDMGSAERTLHFSRSGGARRQAGKQAGGQAGRRTDSLGDQAADSLSGKVTSRWAFNTKLKQQKQGKEPPLISPVPNNPDSSLPPTPRSVDSVITAAVGLGVGAGVGGATGERVALGAGAVGAGVSGVGAAVGAAVVGAAVVGAGVGETACGWMEDRSRQKTDRGREGVENKD